MKKKKSRVTVTEINCAPKEFKKRSKNWHLKIGACKKRYKQTVN